MKKLLLPCLFVLAFSMVYGQQARKLHFRSILVDTHNDILTTAIDDKLSFDQDLKGKTHSDLDRFREGGVDVQIFSVWSDGSYGPGKGFNHANRQIDTLYAVIDRNPDKIALVTNPSQLKKAVRQHKLAAMIGVEGGHMIEDRIDYLDSLYRRGVRYMTLTWNNSTSWATSAMDETPGSRRQFGADSAATDLSQRKKGLTEAGKQIVRRMNELGMMVDLSHVGEQTFWDAIQTTSRPVLVSHSCVYNICPVFRNLKDDQIKAVAKNGGVIHLNFFSGFVDSGFAARNRVFNARHKAERDSLRKTVTDPYFTDNYLFQKYADEVKDLRPPLSLLIDHLDYIVKLVGADYVGLGSDFDGINSSPQQLDDVTCFPLITEELVKRGYSKKDIRKILGENLLRVFKANSAH
ncbi:dipeptidase [Paraflavitalea pollutisoli]|uniref:dipeptidase n=1 Tax=Paraflavitalea pollutisoli TaxID=3034143 RepID=UPI0023ED50DA|nr:dipeptidase [Paraflavitalea sp. H1-2-19X]